MLSYVIRRLLLMIPTLFGITLLVFFVLALSPGGVGGPLLTKSGNMQSEEARAIREYYNKRYGLDQPPIVQYGRWLNRVLPVGFRYDGPAGGRGSFGFKWPDLGESLARHRPVTALIAESLPITLLLNVVSIPVIYTIGVLSGLFAARHRGKAIDVSWGTVSLALWSVPTIWAGVMLIGFLCNSQYVKWFPTAGLHSMLAGSMTFLPRHTAEGWEVGWLLDAVWHLVLPVVCLSYGGFAFLSKLTRGSILENLSADYVRTARAKGLPENTILYRHVFRNSLLSLITVAAAILPALLSGAFIVETIFSIPGMGRLGVEAVQFRDRELVLAVTLIGGLIGLLSTLIRDVLYAVADPRVSYE